jgi:hypothetical protein
LQIKTHFSKILSNKREIWGGLRAVTVKNPKLTKEKPSTFFAKESANSAERGLMHYKLHIYNIIPFVKNQGFFQIPFKKKRFFSLFITLYKRPTGELEKPPLKGRNEKGNGDGIFQKRG